MSSEVIKCERTIHLTDWLGKAGTRKCGKRAAVRELGGLPICLHHANKTSRKCEKKGHVFKTIPL